MNDETTEPDKTAEFSMTDGEWSMPEPVFQSSEGHTPKNVKNVFEGDEHNTEIANIEEVDPFAITPVNTPHEDVEDVTAESIAIEDLPDEAEPADDTDAEPEADDLGIEQEAAENKIRPLPPPKKKGGCATSFLFMFGMVGLTLVVVAGLAYWFGWFGWFFNTVKPTDTGFN